MGVVLPPTHILSQLLIHSCQCLCSAPYTRNGYQRLDEEGFISQEVLDGQGKVGHDITRIANKRILAKYFLYSLQINYLHWKLSASRSIFSCYATNGVKPQSYALAENVFFLLLTLSLHILDLSAEEL